MAESKIQWTQRSDWNPIRGCTRVSPGCVGCYAEGIAARFSGPGKAFDGFARMLDHKPRWTGKVEVQWDRMDAPLRWRKPAVIFALSMSDLFHEKLTVHEIATIYAVMVAAVHVRGHTLQALTKRSERMREILNSEAFWDQVNAEAGAHVMECTDPLNRRSDDARATLDEYGPGNPPPGIWLGVSVEDQTRADERIPDLLATPAAIRFLSCEPLLGPIDLSTAPAIGRSGWLRPLTGGHHLSPVHADHKGAKIDWIIDGGESGPNARPSHPDWHRSLRDQCAAAGVPYFFKQWGEFTDIDHVGDVWNTMSHAARGNQQFLDGTAMIRVGKKRAGALLDGIEHKAMPNV